MKRLRYLPFQITIAILVIIVLMCFASCKAYKDKICMSCPTKTIIKDSIWIKETVRVDTHYKSVPGPVQWLKSPCDSNGNLKPINIVTKKNGLKSTIKSVGNDLHVNCDADSLQELVTTLLIENNILHSEIIEVPTCHKTHKTDNDIFWIKVGKWFLGLLIFYIILRILKKYLKTTFPIIARFLP